MIRRILEHFTDWRGRMTRLDCGHIIPTRKDDEDKGRHRLQKRSCPECTKRRARQPYEPAYVSALHEIRCGCGPCNGRLDPR